MNFFMDFPLTALTKNWLSLKGCFVQFERSNPGLITPDKPDSRPKVQTSVFTLVAQRRGILDPTVEWTQGTNTWNHCDSPFSVVQNSTGLWKEV